MVGNTSRGWAKLALCLALASTIGAADPLQQRDGEAAGKKDNAGTWAPAVKQFVGTAYEAYDKDFKYSSASTTAPISKVWFTGAQGVLTEIFWPAVDVAQTRDHQLLVTDGKSFFFEERKNSITDVQWTHTGIPAFHVQNRDPKGRFEIEKWIFTDPDRDAVFQHYKIHRQQPGLRFYLHHNPSVENTPLGDSALASLGEGPGAGLYAWQDDQAQAVVFSIGLKQASAGFEQSESDGYLQISQHYKLDSTYKRATDGNVVLTAWLDLAREPGDSEFDIVIGFGHDITAARQAANDSLARGYKPVLKKYEDQWAAYQRSVRDLGKYSKDGGKLYRSSVAIMKSMEDKTHSGAFIAAPCVPWGEFVKDPFGTPLSQKTVNNMTAGYHLVWPRDLYQMATGFLAIDDPRSAVASLNYLKSIQLTANAGNWTFGHHVASKDGSFAQNTWVTGEPYWGGVQLDEVSMPIVLAYRLEKVGAITMAPYWDMVKRAADFVEKFGPWSPQERWEDAFGVSPSTMAAELTALAAAADWARRMGDLERARSYHQKASEWSAKLEDWTFTSSGGHGDGRYYQRVEAAAKFDQIWDPNDNVYFFLANQGGFRREKDVTDGGFLELVRFGVRKALSRSVLDTIPKYDSTLRVDVEGFGPSFYRYFGDRYNFDDRTGEQTQGMLWPLLTGERGHFEIGRSAELNNVDPSNAGSPYVSAMEHFATSSYMLPEQVWSDGDRKGKPTGSATPLGWTHAEYIKLLRSTEMNAVFDQVSIGKYLAK